MNPSDSSGTKDTQTVAIAMKHVAAEPPSSGNDSGSRTSTSVLMHR